MSLKIDEIVKVLKNTKIVDPTLTTVVEELKKAESLKKDNKDKEPGSKKQYVILSSNKDTALVVQIEESEDAATTTDKIKKAAASYNATKKGVKFPVKTVSEALGNLPRKFLVGAKVWAKTKEPVRLLNINETL